jgi:large subunit ribosomal protein L24e
LRVLPHARKLPFADPNPRLALNPQPLFLLPREQVTEASRKKRRNNQKATARAIGAVTLEAINKKRTEKPEVRQASRDAALREVKDRAKKAKAEKTQAAAGKSKAPVAKAVKGKGR